MNNISKQFKTGILLIFLLLSIVTSAHICQNAYTSSNLIAEKINLSLSKQLYFAGEQLNIGIETIDAVTGKQLAMSSIVYIEIISQTGSMLQQAKAPITNGTGIATINLSNKLNTDYYYVRAYTRYMQNFDVQYFATERFELINPFKNFFPEEQLLYKTEPISIYTEGQIIRKNQKTKCGFLCTSDSYMPMQTTVSIFSSNQSLISTFATDTNGVAIQYITFPDTGTYTASFTANNTNFSKTISVSNEMLPTILVSDTDTVFAVSTECVPSVGNEFRLEIRKNNIPVLCKSLVASGAFNFNKSDLPKGILKATLLKNDTTVSQVFFSNNKSEISATVSEFEKTAKPRTSYSVSVSAPISGSISYSIVDAQSKTPKQLTNDIIQFGSYFKYSELVLSQTDSCFNEYMLLKAAQFDSKTAQISEATLLPEFEGDVISGKIMIQKTKEPIQGITIFASIPDSIPFLSTAVSQQNGVFYFVTEPSINLSEIVYTIPDTSEKYDIEIDNEFSTQKSTFVPENYVPSKEIRDFVKQQMITMQVADAFKNDFPSNNNAQEKLFPFYGNANQIVYFDEFIKLPIMEEYLKELMTGVYVKKKRGRKYIRLSNFDGRGFIGNNPLVLINGVPIVNHSILLGFDPKKVDYVKLYNYRIFYKNMTFDGVFDLKTKEPIDVGKLISKNNTIESYIAPQTADINEITVAQIPQRIPYFKSTLKEDFNKPFENQQTITFTTSDIKGNYKLSIRIKNETNTTEAIKEILFTVK